MPPKKILAVAGGKGGTGKSFISSNLAVQMAGRNGDVIIIDADFGGPNQHTFFGLRTNKPDLGDFLQNRISSLQATLSATPVPGLMLIKGTEDLLFVSNLNHYKKIRLLRQIKSLEAGCVILDVGTGSSYNSIDFFLLSQPGIVVTTPEPTSVENTYLFLKSCAVRTLKLYINYYGMPASIKEAEESLESQFSSLGYFFERVHSLNALSARLLDRALKKFAPALIMNKARTENDFVLGQSIAEAARRFLGIPITYLGAVPYDEKVQSCLKKFAPYCLEYPQSDLSRALREIAEKLEDQVSAGGGG